MALAVKYSEKPEKAQEIACEALERLDKEGLAPTPENFEVFYNYCSGAAPDIVRAIDKAAKAGGLTAEAVGEVYQKFLSNARAEEAVRKAGDQIAQAIEEMAKMLDSVKSATTEYGDTLEGVSSRVSKVKTIDQLQDIISGVVSDTKRMIEYNQTLEKKLNTSSVQVAELKKDLDSVRREAMTDGLTGLRNRKSFDRDLRNSVIEAMEREHPLTLLMIDIDHFKSFNDNYGHQVGDQVLRLVARTLTDGVKGRDIAARYGGEEFAIVLPETPLQAGVAVANSLRRAIESKDVINRTTNERLGKITISVGVAEFVSGEPLPDFIDRADAALYTAKHNGRNQVAAAPAPDASKSEARA